IGWLNGYIAGLCSAAPFPGHPPGATAPPAGAPDPKVPVSVWFGSQTGNAESLARDFGARLRRAGYEARISPLDEAAAGSAAVENLLVITSTWGDGDPPDNALSWWQAVEA